jgi:cold shock protein
MSIVTGVVKWFNPTKKFGFIKPDQGGKDVFVHISALEDAGIRELREAAKVSFELASNKGKVSAVNIQVVDE